MSVIELTSKNFDEVINNDSKPVLVDFWAGWCGPCMMLKPVVHEAADERDDFVFCSVDVDEQADLAERFSVMSIPTLIVFKNGQIIEKAQGAMSRDKLDMFLDSCIAGKNI
ncbi:MAG: thioredoxin [Clostridia bacterium]|nr:thioredoxin [Clostridia bacterium]